MKYSELSSWELKTIISIFEGVKPEILERWAVGLN